MTLETINQKKQLHFLGDTELEFVLRKKTKGLLFIAFLDIKRGSCVASCVQYIRSNSKRNVQCSAICI